MRATPADVATLLEARVFRARLAALDLSLRDFAGHTNLNYTTVLGWGTVRTTGSGRSLQAFPTWVLLLLREWEAHGVPMFTEA